MSPSADGAGDIEETRPAGVSVGAVAGMEEGEHVGPYLLVEKLGEGGFGAVFAAEQREPVRRRVAVKLLKSAAASADVLARFEAEKQVVAMMNHPGIARLFDAGTTAAGLPYFVMELVSGDDIVSYCKNRGIDLEMRIRIIIDVCAAVTHAHQRGVIHRDLKPGNVLVLDDDPPQPKVIDFGIAKALSPLDTAGDAVRTMRGQLVGTPAYMSPEQLTMPSGAIDVRSDVYSIGAMLYELVTGVRAISADAIASAGLAGLARVVSEASPDAPSTVVSRSGSAGAARIKGELDWIVMKAVERDRVRRYGSAAELARDLRAFLDGQPVSAAPPSVVYQARKFAGRHRGAIALAGAIALGTAVAGVSVVAALVSTTRALDRAEAAEADAVNRAIEADAARDELAAAAYPAHLVRAREAVAFGQREQAIAALTACETRLRGPEWAAIWRTLHPAHASFVGHDPAYLTRGVAFSAAGSLLATASNDGTARAWRSVTRAEQAVYRGHEPGMVLGVDLSPDGSVVASIGGNRQELHLWDSRSGVQLAVGAGHESWVTRVLFSPNGARVATSSDDGTVRVWDATTGEGEAVIRLNREGLFALAWSPLGDVLVAGGDDGVVSVIDAAKSEVVVARPVARGPIGAAAMSPEGGVIAVGGNEGEILVLDAADLSQVQTITAQRQRVSALAWHPAGELLASASSGGAMKLHSVASGSTVGRMLASSGVIGDIRFDADGGSLAVAHADGVARVYDVGELEQTRAAGPGVGPRTGSSAGDQTAEYLGVGLGETRGDGASDLITVDAKGKVTAWHPRTGEVRWRRTLGTDRPLALHAGFGVAAVACRNGTVYMFDSQTGKQISKQNVTAGRGALRAVAAGDAVVLHTWEGVPAIVNLRDRSASVVSGEPPTAVHVDGDRTVTGYRDGSVRFGLAGRDAAAPRPAASIKDATGNADGLVSTGTKPRLVSAVQPVEAHPWSGDASGVLVGRVDGQIELHFDDPAIPVRRFEHALADAVRAFTVDAARGRMIVVTEDGRSTRSFDLYTGYAVDELERDQPLIHAVLLTPQGERVTAGEGVRISPWGGPAGAG
ncbi:MAG: protein kinase [Planctomycetota bacterium]